ncbi:DUF4360 domain-containing protein [Pilimelia terevasa]|nr:DUF4360 domain-containing protein [Pilimelia terevasa]
MSFEGASGTGCPHDSVTSSLSDGGRAITLMYSRFEATTDRAAEMIKRCTSKLKLHYPDGYTYAVVAVDHRGFHDLPAGAVGQLGAQYYFTGLEGEVAARHRFEGPRSTTFHQRHEVATEVWAPCGADLTFNINTSVAVSRGSGATSRATMAIDSQDGSVSEQLNLKWKRCTS